METLKEKKSIKKLTFKDLKKSPLNREPTPYHVELLKDLIDKNGYYEYEPIKVTKDGYIVDGQHRYEACLQLGIECPFVFVDSEDVMIELNASQQSWTTSNFVNYYAAKGYPDFIKLIEFAKKYDLPYVSAAAIIFNKTMGGQLSRIVKFGKLPLTITDELYDEAHKLADEILELLQLMRLQAKDRLIKALIMANRNQKFTFERFKEKLSLQLDRVHVCTTTQGYLSMIENIYNYNCHHKHKITLIK